ncbi:hypothetical protein Agub_g13563 [Astrephomene gubernaculifera]|uniref:Uncharacterized protein n=1 Tax=Astrephomene gubernaculifera TaxID=47775 RepID=A0AAD3HSG6_9CHLO|nr:hypothetical protein Agub_g13563 [Astrephomene gubernaculifera]
MASQLTLPSYVKPAVLEFKRLELEYMDGLPQKVKDQLANSVSFEVEKNHMRHYGDFAFTLAGIKPCALFAHGIGPFYGKGLAEAALLPVMREFNLEEHGFKAEEIKHNMLTSNPIHPGFKSAWVLFNTRHAGYELARKTFMNPACKRMDEEQIGRALGYPFPAGDGTISYIDNTEVQARNTCCVPVLEYFCPSGFETVQLILLHFKRYRSVWSQLGWDLTINTQEHRGLELMSSMRR